MTEETKLKQEIKQYLKVSGWFVFHIRQGKHCYKGISDLIGIKEGITCFIEIKTKTGKLSADQIAFRSEVMSHGGIYKILTSFNDAMDLNDWANQAVY